MRNILLFLLLGSRGGQMRAKIILGIKKKPMNANQLSSFLAVDYKTVQHHLKILTEHNILMVIKEGKYGALYILTPEFEKQFSEFGEIWKQFGNNLVKDL